MGLDVAAESRLKGDMRKAYTLDWRGGRNETMPLTEEESADLREGRQIRGPRERLQGDGREGARRGMGEEGAKGKAQDGEAQGFDVAKMTCKWHNPDRIMAFQAPKPKA